MHAEIKNNRKGAGRIVLLLPFFLFFIFSDVFAQPQIVRVYVEGKKTNVLRNNISIQKIDSLIQAEIEQLSFQNYLFAQLDSYIISEKYINVYLSKNHKFKPVFKLIFADSVNHFPYNQSQSFHSIEQFRNQQLETWHKMRKKGFPFAKLEFLSHQHGDTSLEYQAVYSNLQFIKISDLIVKTEDNAVKSKVLAAHLKLFPGKAFNLENWQQAELSIKSARFFHSFAKSQMELTSEGALLYFYLQKNKVNNASGMLGFSNEGERLNLIGQADVKLRNTFAGMESFDFFYLSNGKEQRKMAFSSDWPYVFGTMFSSDAHVLFNQLDSTALSLSFTYHAGYQTLNNFKFFLGAKYFSFIQATSAEENFHYWMNGFGGEIQLINIQRISGSLKFSIYAQNLAKSLEKKSLAEFFGLATVNLNKSWIFSTETAAALRLGEYSNQQEFTAIGGINSFAGVNENAFYARNFILSRIKLGYQQSLRPFFLMHFLYFNSIAPQYQFLTSSGFGIEIRKNATALELTNAILWTKNDINLQNYKLHIKLINYF